MFLLACSLKTKCTEITTDAMMTVLTQLASASEKIVLLICEGIFFVVGIFLMLTGKLRLPRRRMVTGRHARLVGFFLFIPSPTMLLVGLAIGKENAGNPEQLRQLLISLTNLELIAVAGCYLIALGIAYTSPSSNMPITGLQELPDILTLSEAAQYLRISEADLRQMIYTGRLKAVAVGGDYRISKEALNTVFHP